jgi:hypothetical protein
VSTPDQCRTPGCGRSSCQCGSQSERYYNGTSPCLCSRITRFGKNLRHAPIRIRSRKSCSSRYNLDEMVVIVFRQFLPAQASFKYSTSFGPGLIVGCLLAIVGPEKSV